MFSSRSMRQTLLVLLTAALLLTSCNVGATPAPTLDINAMNTAIVGTTVAQLSAQFTQTAVAAPTNTTAPAETQASIPTVELPTLADASAVSPTTDVAALPTFPLVASTPLPGTTSAPVLPTSQAPATAALGDACHNSVFEGDITVPDGATLLPGVDVQKIWAIRNTGDCLWDDGYALVQIGGSPELGNKMIFEITRNIEFVPAGQLSQMGIWLDVPCAPGKYEAHFRLRDDGGYYFGTTVSVYFEVKEKCP